MWSTAAEPHEDCAASMRAFFPAEVVGNAKEERWRKTSSCDVSARVKAFNYALCTLI